jgi:hypothetical protein
MVIYGSATAKGSRRNKSKTAKRHKKEHYQPGDHDTHKNIPSNVQQYYYNVKFQCFFEILESYAPLLSSKATAPRAFGKELILRG